MAIDSFDAQGRPTRSRQVTDGTTYRFGDAGLPGYEYLRQGALAKMRYPSGREVSYTHDDLGRPLAVNGALGAETKAYVQGVQYTAFGAVSEMRLNGTNLRERFQYSPERLQLTGLDVEKCANENCTGPEEMLHLEYVYGVMNNGNPREQVIRSSGIHVRQVYGYESAGRLAES